ncbi:MAG: hypothetical protein V4497_10645 [Bacteroidota bacterium]
MQKTLRKPENWQDFERLCKKLWGELWEIPHKIKENGRLGQVQKGVDIYGIPKGEKGYWGIQCKGINDDYLKARLSKKEIDEEIKKADKFSPKLDVFIIATTQSKDVVIEQYVREKDIENRNSNGFEIILYCWEDIVDLIDENQQTLNWYLGINNFRENYDFDIAFANGTNKIIANPKFLRLTTKYRAISQNFRISQSILQLSKQLQMSGGHRPQIYCSNKINKSWCSLEITIKNTGNVTLENWSLDLKLDESMRISDGFELHYLMNAETRKMVSESRTLWDYADVNKFLYKPLKEEPLVQKSSRTFEIFFIPNFEQEFMKISWALLAKDFDKTGILEVELKPEFKEEIKYVEVEKKEHFKEDNIEIKELIEEN